MFRIVAQAAGATPVAVPDRELAADVDAIIARAGPHSAICFLANPNNPTEPGFPRTRLARLRAGLPEHCLLVIDAAYADICATMRTPTAPRSSTAATMWR